MKFDDFRRLCLALPDVEERETWGEATFRVKDKIFAMGSPAGGQVSIKASLDDQAGLVEMDPKTFSVSAYTGRFGWVTVRLGGLGKDLAGRLVRNAWERTAPRRVVKEYARSAAGQNARRR
ncbi:MAG TPA: MmcQ/YjbR family DNA-binding protein [Candidatus Dormibacteraeota bacterium]|nr:MmcQ/YjbR family DNA-binding protein [Candidatus Dormibacteraeota bacterium]